MQTRYEWKEDWIPEGSSIWVSDQFLRDLNKAVKSGPKNWPDLYKKKLSYICKLKKPISDKNYMYQIESHYYECYIFGQKTDIRLVYDWAVGEDGDTIVTIGGLVDHRGVKKRRFRESDELGNQLTEEDVLFLERFL